MYTKSTKSQDIRSTGTVLARESPHYPPYSQIVLHPYIHLPSSLPCSLPLFSSLLPSSDPEPDPDSSVSSAVF